MNLYSSSEHETEYSTSMDSEVKYSAFEPCVVNDSKEKIFVMWAKDRKLVTDSYEKSEKESGYTASTSASASIAPVSVSGSASFSHNSREAKEKA